MKTVLITGSSSGIGLATAKYFADRGWNVLATMRDPEAAPSDLRGRQNIELVRLDVQDHGSIQRALDLVRSRFGTLDAVVNNAGYALRGIFEAASPEQVRKEFDTNVLGLMDVTRLVIPVMRTQGHGVIVNVSSIGGRVASPLHSVYQSTKFAVEGFSESLSYELRSQNIRIKIVEPGAIKTDFYTRSMDRVRMEGTNPYGKFEESAAAFDRSIAEKGSPPEVVALCIFRAVTDGSWRLRYHAGKYSTMILVLRRLLPDRMLMRFLRPSVKK